MVEQKEYEVSTYVAKPSSRREVDTASREHYIEILVCTVDAIKRHGIEQF